MTSILPPKTQIIDSLNSNNTAAILDAHQGYILSNTLLLNSTNQTITGTKYFQKHINLKNDSYIERQIRFTNSINELMGAIFLYDNSGENITRPTIYFRQYSGFDPPTTQNTDYYEDYRLPRVTQGRSSNASYDILIDDFDMMNNLITQHSFANHGITFVARKLGDFCQVKGSGSADTTISTGHTFGTLPAGYRPLGGINIAAKNTEVNLCDWLQIHTNGAIVAKNGFVKREEDFNVFYFING